MANKLKCLSRYVNGPAGLVYEAGQVFEVSASVREFLLSDAPGCFEDYVAAKPKPKRARPRTKVVREPPADKAVTSE